MVEREPIPSQEESEDALLEGDVPYRSGTARAALAHREFRVVFIGAFVSNIGSWMQNVVLAAWAYELTRSASFVGLLVFAQLGPLLVLSIFGGMLADAFDRRKLLIAVSFEQMVFSLLIAVLTAQDDPSKLAIVACVFAIGAGQAVYAPTYTAVLPALVGREDLAGAVSLNSTQMNASRVVGPALGGVAFAAFGASWVFVGNALTYPAFVVALMLVRFPPVERQEDQDHGLRRLSAGFRIARHDPLVRRCLITIATFSFFCIVFVGQMPVLAADNLGIEPDSNAYGVFYAFFGMGAVVGAMSIGTLLAGRDKGRLVRVFLFAHAAVLAVFALVRTPALAFPIALVVGLCYFGMITSLSTVLQEHLDDAVRGRVMALWIMGFGGTVPIGNLAFGPVINATSITFVMFIGVAVAVGLGLWFDLDRGVELSALAAGGGPAVPGRPPGSP